jgi:chitodextrinase
VTVTDAEPRDSTRARRRRASLSALAIAAAAAAAAHAEPPGWQVDVYYPEGSIVSYHGRQYGARVSQIDFPGTGWNPTMANLWKPLDARSGARWFSFAGARFARTNTESRCALEWNAANVYTSGGVASVDGVNYRANWWTQGEPPPAHNSGDGGQPWTAVGRCAERANNATDSKEADSRGTAPDGVGPPAVQARATGHTG